MPSRVLAASWIAALVCAASVARAAEPTRAEIQKARDLFAHAEKDEAREDWAAALDKLEAAVAIKETAGLRFHIATCEDKLGRLRAALDDYTAAQMQADKEHNQEVLGAVPEPLTALRARVPTLRLTLPGDVPEATVRVDGRDLAPDERSAPLVLDPGEHRVEASATGRGPFTAKVTLVERDAKTIVVSLPLLAPPPAPAAVRATPAASREETRAPSDGRHHESKTGALIATGGALALAGAGVGAFLLAGSAQSDARDACTRGDAGCDGDRTTVRAWDATALGAWIGAAGVGALAVYLWAKPSETTSSAAATHVDVGPTGARVWGRF